jgi:ABC-type lipoprotein release transport system permease subunit
MTFFRLLLRNLFYHWRGNLAVLLGVAVGTAVLTGALLVGDSLRGSLRALTLDQLGWVDVALIANRFFRAQLADGLPAQRVSPAILLQGSANRGQRRVSKVTLLGIDQRFWPDDLSLPDAAIWQRAGADVVVNASLAEALEVKVGDAIVLNVQKPDEIPRETLLGKRKAEDVVNSLKVTVRQLMPDKGMGRFAVKPSPEPPRNAFVPLAFLQRELKIPQRVNALFAGLISQPLKPVLTKQLTLADWNVRLRTPEERALDFVKYLNRGVVDRLKRVRWKGHVPEKLAKLADADGDLAAARVIAYFQEHRPYLSLESQQMFLERAVVRANEIASGREQSGTDGAGTRWRYEATLVYLADTLATDGGAAPYVIVAGVGGDVGAGELQPPGPLAADELALARWAGSPLNAKPGDKATLTYYVDNDKGQLRKEQHTFVIRTLFPLQGKADDPDITPPFPGITDKLDMASWENPPFPFEPKRIKPMDEEFWKRYRTTPRAYVNLATAQKLWASRFGSLTSIRIPLEGKDAKVAKQEVSDGLLAALEPELGGFVFQDVKNMGLQAGAGSTDFGEYFLYFSFFLIVAALLLVGLLFRLNIDRRAPEIGLLLAVGCRRRAVRLLLLGEGGLLAVLGGLIGIAGAVGYAQLLLGFLSVNWPGEKRLNFLEFHAESTSFLIGYGSALLVSVATIFWATRVLGRVAPKSLLAGETTSVPTPSESNSRRRWSSGIGLASAVGVVACLALGFLFSDHMAQALSFFGSGTFLLILILAELWAWMRRQRHQGMIARGPLALLRLGTRNAARHPVRSLLTIGLLASATFLVVAVQSFHREASADFLARDGGGGGFPLLVETDVPIFQDLNSPDGKADLFAPQDVPSVLKDVVFYPFRVRAGDDASCLNLYQPLRPRLLGVPESLIHRGGFQFSSSLAAAPADKENPWRLLEGPDGDGIPAFADANTAQWILHMSLGQTLEITDDLGNKHKLRLVGLLQESVFQSELLIADTQFKKLFPRREGFSFFLLDAAPAASESIRSALQSAENAPGLFVMPSVRRIESYLAVENMYLATFQALGGLGLILGALGLAVVLLRSVWERRGELALLRALGFRRRSLGWLVLAENGYLLILGLAIGAIAALVAVAPYLIGSGGEVLWLQVLLLLALVSLAGLVSAAVAVAATLRAPLLEALRRE